jgi:TPR repeat protein
MLTLDDTSARISGDLVTDFKRAIEASIQNYFKTEEINWSAVTTALMMVSADTNHIAKLDYDLALYCFTLYMNGHHQGEREDDPLVAAAKGGSVDAQLRLALRYQEGQDVPQDLKEAVHWYQTAAANGSAVAERTLG